MFLSLSTLFVLVAVILFLIAAWVTRNGYGWLVPVGLALWAGSELIGRL